jgi:hypothetical protein
MPRRRRAAARLNIYIDQADILWTAGVVRDMGGGQREIDIDRALLAKLAARRSAACCTRQGFRTEAMARTCRGGMPQGRRSGSEILVSGDGWHRSKYTERVRLSGGEIISAHQGDTFELPFRPAFQAQSRSEEPSRVGSRCSSCCYGLWL